MWSSQWFSNLSNWNNEAWKKKSGLQRDSNPWPPRYKVKTPEDTWSVTIGCGYMNVFAKSSRVLCPPTPLLSPSDTAHFSSVWFGKQYTKTKLTFVREQYLDCSQLSQNPFFSQNRTRAHYNKWPSSSHGKFTLTISSRWESSSAVHCFLACSRASLNVLCLNSSRLLAYSDSR